QPPTHPHHLTAHFTQYAELDQPTHITTHTPSQPHTQPHTTHITGHQNNQPIFTTTLTTHPTP
ncbi:hypothetical protein ACGF3J_38705, partial [Streptomyces sp. NPDC048171]